MADFVVVRIPRDVLYLGSIPQQGSPLTGWLRSFEVPSENWLAHRFKASFDAVAGVAVEGFGPRSHRLQSFGHDPLVGMVVGTIDVIRGGMTAIGSDGTVTLIARTGDTVYNPITALVTVLGHQLSDAFTPMGLPVPGWSLTQLLQFGSFGERDRTLAEIARFMYLKGYDLRHFLTMSTSTAAAEILLLLYFAIREYGDPLFASDLARDRALAGAEFVIGTPRYQAASLLAHGVAVAANAGKIAAYGGNPLALNIAQWVRFSSALFSFLRTRLASATSVLLATARANADELDAMWPLPSVQDPDWPTL